MRDNYYHILGLDNFATEQEIKGAYRKLAKKYHPDRNPDKPDYEEKFKRVNRAYNILTNPEKKAAFDRALKLKLHPRRAPVYAPKKHYYTTEKNKYTPTAWMYARIFIIGFIMAIILIPIGLLYKASVAAYENGLEEVRDENYYESINYFYRAISTFGGRSLQAGIKGSEISIYHLRNYKQGLHFANLALEHADSQTEYALIHYLKGIANRGMGNYKEALSELKKAESLQYITDSLQLQFGLINAFSLNDFKEGEKNFTYLIEHHVQPKTAWLGKAWCLQNQDFYEQAAQAYSRVIELDSTHALAYYYKGMNEISINDSTAACHDFNKALQLGYAKAAILFKYHCEE